ncbi:hypothetical protein U1Q18_041116, partial [Sarracenia purpurea var. burkii]
MFVSAGRGLKGRSFSGSFCVFFLVSRFGVPFGCCPVFSFLPWSGGLALWTWSISWGGGASFLVEWGFCLPPARGDGLCFLWPVWVTGFYGLSSGICSFWSRAFGCGFVFDFGAPIGLALDVLLVLVSAETQLASRRGSSPLPAAAMGRCGLYLITILASLGHLMHNSWWDRGLVNRAVVDIFSSVRYICSDVLFGSPSS